MVIGKGRNRKTRSQAWRRKRVYLGGFGEEAALKEEMKCLEETHNRGYAAPRPLLGCS
jgi:hypothetical protein